MQSVLHYPILILNKSWYPIDSTTVRDSFSDVMSEKAQFLDVHTSISHNIDSWISLKVQNHEPFIKTPTAKIKVPEIMLLTDYQQIPKRKVVFNRRNLWRRDGHICQYCGIEPQYDEITVDHITPKSKNGQTTFFNCVLCCLKCNLKKANRTLKEAKMKLQRKKRLPNGDWTVIYYEKPKHPVWNPLYGLVRKSYPKSWIPFLKNFDENLYWEIELVQ